MKTRRGSPGGNRGRAGFTLLELTITLAVAGTMVVAVSAWLAVAGAGLVRLQDRVTAMQLGTGMLEEISNRRWDERSDTWSAILWIDLPGSEWQGKKKFDDIDDFNFWIEAPPTDPRDQDPIPDVEEYVRAVTVTYVDENLDFTFSPTYRKLVTVQVWRDDRLLYETRQLFTPGRRF